MEGLANHRLNAVTEQVIKVFYKVYNTLGYGFLEKVYVKALFMELQKAGILAKLEAPIQVFYEGSIIGEILLTF